MFISVTPLTGAASTERSGATVAFLIATCAVLALTAPLTGPTVLGGMLPDPDSYMRLVRLRDGALAGQGLIDSVARAGDLPLHWSRLLDVVLLALAAGPACLVGWPAALHWTGALAGPVGAGLMVAGAVRIVRPACPLLSALVATAGLMMSTSTLAYGALGRAGYHTLLPALIIGAVGTALRALATRDRTQATLAGVFVALALWLGVESAPYAAMVLLGALVYAAVSDRPNDDAALATRMSLSCALVLALALLVDPPHRGWLSPDLDRLSLLHIGAVLVLAGTGGALRFLGRWGRRGAVVGCALILAAAMLAALAHGPETMIGPDLKRLWWDHILEIRPTDTLPLLGAALPPLLPALLVPWLATNPWVRGYLLATVLAATAATLLHIRFATYLDGFGLVGLVALMSRQPTLRHRLRLLLATLVLMVGGWSLACLDLEVQKAPVLCRFSPATAAWIDQTFGSGPHRILADLNYSSAILYLTPYSVVAAPYHRGVTGLTALLAAWRAPAAMAQAPVLATGADLILACPGAKRDVLVADLAPPTLGDVIGSGPTPPWLTRAGIAPGGFRLYRITALPSPGLAP